MTTLRESSRPHRVLVDATKLLDERRDGVRRYVVDLLTALIPLVKDQPDRWEIDLRMAQFKHVSLLDAAADLLDDRTPETNVPSLLLRSQRNPLLRSAARLTAMKSKFNFARVSEWARYQSLKLQRSLVKRWPSLHGRSGKDDHEAARAYDLMHITLPNTWHCFTDLQIPAVTTVHDLSHLACPQFQTPGNVQTLADGLQRAEDAVSEYISVSASTGQQMQQKLGIHAGRIQVIHNGSDPARFYPVEDHRELNRVRSKYGIGNQPFVLALSTIEPRKNLFNTVQAFRRLVEEQPNLAVNLVIAGTHGWGEKDQLQAAISSCDRIMQIGFVPDEDLAGLYSAADLFCYASHYEGFGLPLVESMRCGTSVVFGNTSSMPEVVGSGGLGVVPTDVADIQRALAKLLGDDALRKWHAAQGLEQGNRFNWQRTAELTLACYERCIEEFQARAGRWHASDQPTHDTERQSRHAA